MRLKLRLQIEIESIEEMGSLSPAIKVKADDVATVFRKEIHETVAKMKMVIMCSSGNLNKTLTFVLNRKESLHSLLVFLRTEILPQRNMQRRETVLFCIE